MTPNVFYLPIVHYKGNQDDPLIHEHSPHATVESIVDDIITGQIEHVDAVIMIDRQAGTAKDVTEQIAGVVGDETFNRRQEPFNTLADWLDGFGIFYYKEQ